MRCPAALATSLPSCAAFQPAVQVPCCVTACRPGAPMCSRSTAEQTSPARQTVTLTPVCLQAHAPMYINKHVWDESKTHVKYVANPADGPSLPSCAAFQPAVQVPCCVTACRPGAPMCSRSTAEQTSPARQTVTLTPVCLQAHAPMYINKHVWDESKTHVKYVANPADGERAAALLKVLTGSEELPERPLSGKEALVTPRSATVAPRRCLSGWRSVVAGVLLLDGSEDGQAQPACQRTWPANIAALSRQSCRCCRKEDPEPVKRLKREMAVALAEEDYDAAARIRDHPFMVKAMEVLKYRQLGSDSEADRILHDLKSNIAAENERHAQEYQQQRSRSQ